MADFVKLGTWSYRPLAYQQQDLEALQALADHCGGALARIHAAMDLQRLVVQVASRSLNP